MNKKAGVLSYIRPFLLEITMGLMDVIRADAARITSNLNEFPVVVNMVAPGGQTITITAIHTKHHLGIDTEGNMVNSKKASIAFSESFLLQPYPCRNLNQEVDMKNHKVSVKDSTGIFKNYIVQQWFPDEALGLIVLILEDFQ